MKKRRVALVLAGGGARGVAHIGAIEELERQGFEISAVAGTSVRAVVAMPKREKVAHSSSSPAICTARPVSKMRPML